ncbi:hypothetical protein [Collinsella stercoris]|uniref:Uncharacterized protein n=1 Tax=Collinsella stercoris DSM 13279 TaxID=445975 RepID=B6GDZ0_9ACTN|nr:hypothetical protein [Collinsella stercoris]EEA89503.1 hypothetical protein COLSTE_02325 [Collinsella stercoris DSM 13279]UEA45078.1 hypothetical protein LK434_08040 [Collinsella stercoris DSM 13279]UWP12399.1 hypothetical protein NQ498_03985 [Collinsella stercoris]
METTNDSPKKPGDIGYGPDGGLILYGYMPEGGISTPKTSPTLSEHLDELFELYGFYDPSDLCDTDYVYGSGDLCDPDDFYDPDDEDMPDGPDEDRLGRWI